MLEKTLECPLDCKEIQPVHPKGDQSWVFIGRKMLNLKLQYFGHLMQSVDSLEKTLMLGGIGGRRRRGRQRMRWLDGITNSQSLLKLMPIELVMPSNHPILCRPLSYFLQSFPASRSFQMSQLFASDGQSIGVSASTSVFSMNIQD